MSDNNNNKPPANKRPRADEDEDNNKEQAVQINPRRNFVMLPKRRRTQKNQSAQNAPYGDASSSPPSAAAAGASPQGVRSSPYHVLPMTVPNPVEAQNATASQDSKSNIAVVVGVSHVFLTGQVIPQQLVLSSKRRVNSEEEDADEGQDKADENNKQNKRQKTDSQLVPQSPRPEDKDDVKSVDSQETIRYSDYGSEENLKGVSHVFVGAVFKEQGVSHIYLELQEKERTVADLPITPPSKLINPVASNTPGSYPSTPKPAPQTPFVVNVTPPPPPPQPQPTARPFITTRSLSVPVTPSAPPPRAVQSRSASKLTPVTEPRLRPVSSNVRRTLPFNDLKVPAPAVTPASPSRGAASLSSSPRQAPLTSARQIAVPSSPVQAIAVPSPSSRPGPSVANPPIPFDPSGKVVLSTPIRTTPSGPSPSQPAAVGVSHVFISKESHSPKGVGFDGYTIEVSEQEVEDLVREMEASLKITDHTSRADESENLDGLKNDASTQRHGVSHVYISKPMADSKSPVGVKERPVQLDRTQNEAVTEKQLGVSHVFLATISRSQNQPPPPSPPPPPPPPRVAENPPSVVLRAQQAPASQIVSSYGVNHVYVANATSGGVVSHVINNGQNAFSNDNSRMEIDSQGDANSNDTKQLTSPVLTGVSHVYIATSSASNTLGVNHIFINRSNPSARNVTATTPPLPTPAQDGGTTKDSKDSKHSAKTANSTAQYRGQGVSHVFIYSREKTDNKGRVFSKSESDDEPEDSDEEKVESAPFINLKRTMETHFEKISEDPLLFGALKKTLGDLQKAVKAVIAEEVKNEARLRKAKRTDREEKEQHKSAKEKDEMIKDQRTAIAVLADCMFKGGYLMFNDDHENGDANLMYGKPLPVSRRRMEIVGEPQSLKIPRLVTKELAEDFQNMVAINVRDEILSSDRFKTVAVLKSYSASLKQFKDQANKKLQDLSTKLNKSIETGQANLSKIAEKLLDLFTQWYVDSRTRVNDSGVSAWYTQHGFAPDRKSPPATSAGSAASMQPPPFTDELPYIQYAKDLQTMLIEQTQYIADTYEESERIKPLKADRFKEIKDATDRAKEAEAKYERVSKWRLKLNSWLQALIKLKTTVAQNSGPGEFFQNINTGKALDEDLTVEQEVKIVEDFISKVLKEVGRFRSGGGGSGGSGGGARSAAGGNQPILAIAPRALTLSVQEPYEVLVVFATLMAGHASQNVTAVLMASALEPHMSGEDSLDRKLQYLKRESDKLVRDARYDPSAEEMDRRNQLSELRNRFQDPNNFDKVIALFCTPVAHASMRTCKQLLASKKNGPFETCTMLELMSSNIISNHFAEMCAAVMVCNQLTSPLRTQTAQSMEKILQMQNDRSKRKAAYLLSDFVLLLKPVQCVTNEAMGLAYNSERWKRKS